MLEYARIHVSEEIDANKSTMSREFIICHYQYFFDINFRFQPKVCDGYHDLKGPEMSRVGSNFTCYVVMRIYLRVLKKHENYYPQVLLKNVNISSKKD